MESLARARAAHLVQLSVASRKLREVLGALEELPEGAQDQVADLVRALRDSLRLTALPLEVLSIILRKAGRHTRRVARLWKDTYGPLDCGIELQGISSKEDIDCLLSQDPLRFHHTTSLVLIVDEADTQPGQAAEITAAVPVAFPQLRSVHLPYTLTPADLQALQPLSPTLTALTLWEMSPLLPHMSSILQLTSLRSISFSCSLEDVPYAPGALEALSSLPHLRQLSFAPLNDFRDHSASLLMSSLRNLDLTDLNLEEIYMYDWDSDSTDTLRTAMPHLSALTMLLNFSSEPTNALPGDDPCWNFSVMAALAQRTALRSLTMKLVHLSQEHHNLGRLSALQLAELHVCAEGVEEDNPNRGDKLSAVLEAMAVQRSLTSLSIGPGAELPELSPAGLQSLGTFASRLQKLHLSAYVNPPDKRFFDVLATMSQLKHLVLEAVDVSPEGVEASWQKVSQQLAALEVLEVTYASSHLLRATLQHITTLTNLRALNLQVGPRPGAVPSLDAALYQIVSLQHQLTRLALDVHASSGSIVGAILGRMTALQHMELNGPRELMDDPRLPQYLLPLPPALRLLHVRGLLGLSEEVLGPLRAAAARQDCALPLVMRHAI